jgi:hypothetical protein
MIEGTLDPDEISASGCILLNGRWSLEGLEALCVVMRDQLGGAAEGAEEYLVKNGALKSIMPMARLQAIVRERFNQFVTRPKQDGIVGVAEILNALVDDLAGLKCAQTTQILAAGMLLSLVYGEDQEISLRKVEQLLANQQEAL